MTEHPEWELPDPNNPANVQELGEGTTDDFDPNVPPTYEEGVKE